MQGSKQFRFTFVHAKSRKSDLISCRPRKKSDFVSCAIVSPLPSAAPVCLSHDARIWSILQYLVFTLGHPKASLVMRKRIEFQGFLQIGRVSREFFHCFIFELTTGKDGWTPLIIRRPSAKSLIFRRIIARSKVGFALISAIYLQLPGANCLHDAKSEYG